MPELLKSFAWDAFVLFYYAQVIGLDAGKRAGKGRVVVDDLAPQVKHIHAIPP